jgi:hypothetical protein
MTGLVTSGVYNLLIPLTVIQKRRVSAELNIIYLVSITAQRLQH